MPGADPAWSAHLHTPILDAIRRRDVEAAVAALEDHFAEAADNMATRWPADEEPLGEAPGRATQSRRTAVTGPSRGGARAGAAVR